MFALVVLPTARWMRLAEQFWVAYVDEPLIGLRNSAIAPHQFDDHSGRERGVTRRMFWEARLRHFRTRPLRLFAEAFRHLAFVIGDATYLTAIAVWHRGDTFWGSRQTRERRAS